MTIPDGYAIYPIGNLWRAVQVGGAWFGPLRAKCACAAEDARSHANAAPTTGTPGDPISGYATRRAEGGA